MSKVLPKVDGLIKKLNSWNEKKRLKAKMALSKVAGNILPYLIKKFKNKEWKNPIQYDELQRFYDIINQEVAQVGIGCVDEEGNILWFAMLKGKTNKGAILVGVNNKVINVYSVIDNKFRDIYTSGKIDDVFCKKEKDNQWYYLVLVERRTVANIDSYIFSPRKIYRNVKRFIKSKEGKRYALIMKKANKKEVVIIDGIESKEYDEIGSFTFSSRWPKVWICGEKRK
jgi:hypothetical protein